MSFVRGNEEDLYSLKSFKCNFYHLFYDYRWYLYSFSNIVSFLIIVCITLRHIQLNILISITFILLSWLFLFVKHYVAYNTRGLAIVWYNFTFDLNYIFASHKTCYVPVYFNPFIWIWWINISFWHFLRNINHVFNIINNIYTIILPRFLRLLHLTYSYCIFTLFNFGFHVISIWVKYVFNPYILRSFKE